MRALCAVNHVRRLVAGLALVLLTCDKSPADAFDRKEIDRLPLSTRSVQVRGLGDDDVGCLARLSNLQMVFFGWGFMAVPSRITDRGVAALAKLDLPRLQLLDFGYCDHLTDAALAQISSMHQVTDLQLRVCQGITDAGLRDIGRMTWLNRLDLRGCDGITDAGLDALTGLVHLHELMLGGCGHVTSEGVARLQASLASTKVEKDEEEWARHEPGRERPR